MFPDAIKKFIDAFSKLPSIGPRQAMRLAFRLVRNGPTYTTTLAQAIQGLASVKICTQCFFMHTNDGNRCSLCTDTTRDYNTILIVEKETDLITIERTGTYQGIYLVLGELTKSGVFEDIHKQRIQTLIQHIQTLPDQMAQEIIIALNPTTYGDLHTSLLRKELTPYAHIITRLGRGIPTGGEIEFTDEETLEHSLKRRH